MNRPLTRDQRIAELAERQHGVVSRGQLLAAGLNRCVAEHRLASGRLRRLHRGVYQVGPVAPPFAREMAAVLACGPHAAVSHLTAAALRRMTDPSFPSDPVDVSVTSGDPRSRPGIRVHRRTDLAEDEVTLVHGIRVTSAARTILDLAGTAPPLITERALAEALVQRMTPPAAVAALLDHHPHRAGVAALRALLAGGGEAGLMRSKAELRFRELMDRAGLPKPQANRRVLGRRRDFVWPRERVVVEIDSYRFHSGRSRFEGDRDRDGELFAAGYRHQRVTWRQMTEEPEKVIARMAQALAMPPRD